MMAVRCTAWAFLWAFHAFQTTNGQVTECTSGNGESCVPAAVDVSVGCATLATGVCQANFLGEPSCRTEEVGTNGDDCNVALGCTCFSEVCVDPWVFFLCVFPPACPDGSNICDDPHMKGLHGQKIDWSGVDGGWYSMIKDDHASLHVNVRVTAPLPEEFPDRQLVTGLSVLSEGHSLIIEVKNPYDIDTTGCARGNTPCLANGGLRALVDGAERDDLLQFSRDEYVVDGITISASNLPAECRQFGGDRIWARMYDEMLQGTRQLAAEKTFEDWILRFGDMAAPTWCTQYLGQHGLADLQSSHAVFKIVTSTVTVRLNVGTNYQVGGDVDWDGRVLPDLEFWQMDVGLHGLSLENELLSGMLGETARPVLDGDGRQVMEGYEAFRGSVEDYRVSGPLGTDFALLNKL